MNAWYLICAIATCPLVLTQHLPAGTYKPICERVGLLSDSQAMLSWIAPVMPDEEPPVFQVIYIDNGGVVAERTLETKLKIPVEVNATQVNAIVRTITPSDVESEGYQKGPNECRFRLDISNKSAVFYHLPTEFEGPNPYVPQQISLLPISSTMTKLTWDSPALLTDALWGYEVTYTFGKEILRQNVTDSTRLQIPIEANTMGVEAQIAAITAKSDHTIVHKHRSAPVFLDLSESDPNLPRFVNLNRIYGNYALLTWQPPRNETLKIKEYEYFYLFDHSNMVHTARSSDNKARIEIPEGVNILKAAVGVVKEPAETQFSIAYTPIKYLDLRDQTFIRVPIELEVDPFLDIEVY